ncbi:MAG: hypothetical protein GY822_06755 [Deltaproteobacteria bacterium]|nr:hypothetical protein [Deltaproteobacteria bacterium]
MNLPQELRKLTHFPLVLAWVDEAQLWICPPHGETACFSVDNAQVRAGLNSLWRSPSRLVLFVDAKQSLSRLCKLGVDVARPVDLQTLSKVAGVDLPRFTKPQDTTGFSDLAIQALTHLDACMSVVDEKGLRGVARLECMVLRSIAQLEHRGLAIDKEGWQVLVDEAKSKRTEERRSFLSEMGDAIPKDLFGEPDFHLDSDEELKTLLNRKFKLELPDVSKHTLARVEHRGIPHLLAYREANKIVTTYGDSFLEFVDDDLRLRAEFTPLGASTGRISSRSPNLQNLPSDRRFHACLKAPKDRKLITADYGACELRILAELSGDERFLDFFARGVDLHAAVASRLFRQEVSKETNPELRQQAKAINFGLCYGMGAQSLGNQLGLSLSDAERLLEKYFAAFPGIQRKLETLVDDALRKGYAQTLLGRKLHFDVEVLRGPNARGELSRIAKNMPIQGSSADMTKLAMVLLSERLLQFDDAGLVNTVHDELVVECAAHEMTEVATAVENAMCDAHRILLHVVPPQVDVHIGDVWMH